MPAKRKIKSLMQCPKCSKQMEMYVVPVIVQHRCPSNKSQWTVFQQVEVEDDEQS